MRKRFWNNFFAILLKTSKFSCFFIQFVFCLIFITQFHSTKAIYAQGNLAIVFNVPIGKTSIKNPQYANLTDLWCQATNDGKQRVAIKDTKFVQVLPNPTRIHQAKIVSNRAYLHFGKVTPDVVGKYRCEITTENNEFVTGNLFVYMRPIFTTNGSLRLEQHNNQRPFEFMGSSSRATRGEIARITCPVIGYPIPMVIWFKENSPILFDDYNEKYIRSGNDLLIRNVEDSDEGIYKCLATNSFANEVESVEQNFEALLEQPLRVAGSLSWIIPLIIIIVSLILLFAIIYLCAAWKTYKFAQYNVAEKEKKLRESEQLHDEFDDEE